MLICHCPLFYWDNPEVLSCDDCLTPSLTPLQSTFQTITVIDENGCEASDLINIFVRKNFGVYIPNVFSPNGDGNNDFFTVFANESVTNVELLIADRWGEIVFQEKNLIPGELRMGWNGTVNDQALNPAVFVYMAKVTFIDGRTEVLSGDVSLIR